MTYYRLENEISYESLGVVGKREVLAKELILELKKKLNLDFVRASIQKDVFKKIAIVSGSGKDLIKDAYFKGADCLITGEVGHQRDFAGKVAIHEHNRAWSL